MRSEHSTDYSVACGDGRETRHTINESAADCYDGFADPTAGTESFSLVNASDSSEHC